MITLHLSIVTRLNYAMFVVQINVHQLVKTNAITEHFGVFLRKCTLYKVVWIVHLDTEDLPVRRDEYDLVDRVWLLWILGLMDYDFSDVRYELHLITLLKIAQSVSTPTILRQH